MPVPTKFAIVTYEMHEPYDYAKLWEILHAEGLKDCVLSDFGSWTKLPESTWAAPVLGFDVAASASLLSRSLTAAIKAAGLNVDLFVSASELTAWVATEGTPAPPAVSQASASPTLLP